MISFFDIFTIFSKNLFTSVNQSVKIIMINNMKLLFIVIIFFANIDDIIGNL